MTEAATGSGRDRVREHIVRTAAGLLAGGGRDAVSTRAVAAAAGTQAPTIYRLFGDKAGLLAAVAEHGYATYLAAKPRPRADADPVDQLRAGWDLHVDFGLANPALFTLMYGDPRPGELPGPAVTAFGILRGRILAIAASGRLRIGPGLAADTVHAAACGTVLTLLASPEDRRDPALSATTREAVVAAITTDPAAAPDPGPVPAAATLLAHLPTLCTLTDGERHLLEEWLTRISRLPREPSRTPAVRAHPAGS